MSTHSSSSYERSETGFSEVGEERGPVSLSLDLEREGMPRRKAGRALNPPDMRGRNSSDHKIGDPVPQESGGVQRAVWNQEVMSLEPKMRALVSAVFVLGAVLFYLSLQPLTQLDIYQNYVYSY